MKFVDGTVTSPISKFLTEEIINNIKSAGNVENGDLILIAADKWTRCYTILGALRLEIARREKIMESVKNQYSFHWVLDFPMFEYDDESGKYTAMHHAFTSPMDEDLDILETSPDKARAKAYDIVLNGAEVGGGSIRIHRNDVQQTIFKLMGMTKEEADMKFGFLLEALKYGCPPHGGLALGLDRMTMILAGIDNIRDVIAFPKTTSALSLMDGAPTMVDESQLKELGLQLLGSEK